MALRITLSVPLNVRKLEIYIVLGSKYAVYSILHIYINLKFSIVSFFILKKISNFVFKNVSYSRTLALFSTLSIYIFMIQTNYWFEF